MKHLHIRPARSGDASRLAELSGELGYATSAPEVAERLAALEASDEHVVLVAEPDAGKLAGWIHCFTAPRLTAAPFLEIGGLVVAEAWRGRGVGTALVAEAEKWAAARRLTRLRVRTNVIRRESRRFYERLGFERVKTQDVFSKRVR